MSIPVIGLDRDGTINEDIGDYVTKPEQFKPIQGSLEAVKMLRNKGYDVVILTNQAGIQKGTMDEVDVDIVHNYMMTLLGEIGCKSINGLYYSTTPFKDDPYRKPNIGMFKRASSEIGVDWTNGVYVGDKITDLKAAVKAKAKPAPKKKPQKDDDAQRVATDKSTLHDGRKVIRVSSKLKELRK